MRYLIVLAVLGGCCATEKVPEYSWQRPGASKEQMLSEQEACKAMARNLNASEDRQIGFYSACMRRRGWRMMKN